MKKYFNNIIKYSAYREVLRKVRYRLISKKEKAQVDTDFLSKEAITNIIDYVDNEIWKEGIELENALNQKWSKLQSKKKYKGEADVKLLYYITRMIKPEFILETGVASGFSSAAFLTAITNNKKGKLFSSDFPYLSIDNPESMVGVVVEDKLKLNWNLLLKGDRVNLPEILIKLSKIDIFHYDSDKSYEGREFAFNLIKPKLHQDSILIFDDIDDNNFFKDYFQNSNFYYRLIKYNSKYIGVCTKNDQILKNLFKL